MAKVAKLVLIDNTNKYLLMYRSNHPAFGTDPDLPGGTLEEDEQPVDTMIREVYEEAGIVITEPEVQEVYAGVDYSTHGTYYSLYVAKLDNRPTVTMSWEHSSFEWIDKDDFLEKSKSANDTFMHMVYDVLK